MTRRTFQGSRAGWIGGFLLLGLLYAGCPSPAKHTVTPAPAASTPELERLIDEAWTEAMAYDDDGKADTAEQLKRLNWWVHTRLELVDVASPVTPERILSLRHAECAASTIAFQAILNRKMGLPARSVGLFCVPRQSGHSQIEVYYDGGWHLFDPYFGVFFTADGRMDSPVISLADLKNFPEMATRNVFYPVSQGKLGRAYPPPAPTPLEGQYSRTQPAYEKDWGNFALFVPHLCGAASYATGAVLQLPFTVWLAPGAVESLGTVDHHFEDVDNHLGVDGEYDSSGQYVLGDDTATYLGPIAIEHRYRIEGLVPGARVRVTLHRWEGAALRNIDFQVFGGKAVNLAFPGDATAVVDLVSSSRRIDLISRSRAERRIYFDAIGFERFE